MYQVDFESFFDASPYPQGLLSVPDFTIVAVNNAYRLATGRAATRLVGRPFFEAFPPSKKDPTCTNVAALQASLERVIATRRPDTIPFIRFAVDAGENGPAEERWWSVVHTPLLDSQSELRYIGACVIDVTELYTLERTPENSSLPVLQHEDLVARFKFAQMHQALVSILDQERSHLRTLFDQAPAFMAVLRGRDLVFEVVNDAYLQLVGHRDILGKPVMQALPEVSGQGFEALLIRVLERGEPHVARNLTLQVQPEPDGALVERHVDLLYQPVFDSKGAVSAIFALGIDITETVVAQVALAEQLKELQAAKARQAFQLQLTDVLRRLTDSDEVFRQSSEVLGRHLEASRVLFGEYDLEDKLVTCHSNYVKEGTEAIHGTYPVESFGTENFASLEDGTMFVSEDTALDPRTAGVSIGATHWALRIRSVVAVPLGRKGARIACLFVNDSRVRKWSDDEKLLIADAAERIWSAVERSRAESELRQADKRKDQFLAMLAHELRNPIAPIRAAAELLLRAPGDRERVAHASRIIARQTAHMTSIVDDLLDVARVTGGLVTLHKEEVDLKRVLSDAVEQMRSLMKSRRQVLSTLAAPERFLVLGDFKRLVQVFANLLGNAAKYTPEEGRIQVRLDATPEHVVVRIADNGIGIASDLLPHVFKLFSQGERTTDRSTGGLGLGLSLVKSLVDLHGGEVFAKSEGVDKGSEFGVRLPRLVGSAVRRAKEIPRPVGLVEAAVRRILVVDDNVDAAELLASVLTDEGHTVAVEHDPHLALERVHREAFDVFILDIGLPGIDGAELARRLRAQPETAPSLMVAVSGYAPPMDVGSADSPFDYYFVKPVTFSKLGEVLRERQHRAPKGKAGAV